MIIFYRFQTDLRCRFVKYSFDLNKTQKQKFTEYFLHAFGKSSTKYWMRRTRFEILRAYNFQTLQIMFFVIIESVRLNLSDNILCFILIAHDQHVVVVGLWLTRPWLSSTAIWARWLLACRWSSTMNFRRSCPRRRSPRPRLARRYSAWSPAYPSAMNEINPYGPLAFYEYVRGEK